MNILFIFKVKVHVLIKWSCRFSQLCWLGSLELLLCFEHINQISLKLVSCRYLFLEAHFTTYHSNVGYIWAFKVHIQHNLKGNHISDHLYFHFENSIETHMQSKINNATPSCSSYWIHQCVHVIFVLFFSEHYS